MTASQTLVKTFQDINREPGTPQPTLEAPWQVRAVVNDDNMTYIVSNTETREALLIDPMREDVETLRRECHGMKDYTWLMVLDTHTHADHVSSAAEMAHFLNTPLVMHHAAPSKRVRLRVSRDTLFPCKAGSLRLMEIPGHTPDGLALLWGPMLFVGDTLLHADTGRDDLPGGDPIAHYDSVRKLAVVVQPSTWVFFGHDNEGGRATTWGTQLTVNPMLTMERERFIHEAASYVGPAPKHLKESLFENFK